MLANTREVYKKNIDDNFKTKLIDEAMAKIQFENVAAIQQLISAVEKSQPKRSCLTYLYNSCFNVKSVNPINTLPILADIKELYDNEYSYVCPENLPAYQEQIEKKLNEFVMELKSKTTAELEELIKCSHEKSQDSTHTTTIVANAARQTSNLTFDQVASIREINAQIDYLNWIGFTTKNPEANVCIDCAQTIIEIQDLRMIEKCLDAKLKENVHFKAIQILGKFFAIMEQPLGYSSELSLRFLGKDKISGAHVLLENILFIFNASKITLREFNAYDSNLRVHLLLFAFKSLRLVDRLDTESNLLYMRAEDLLSNVNSLIESGQYRERNELVRYYKFYGSSFLNNNFAIRTCPLSFNFAKAQKHLVSIIQIFEDIIAPYALDAAVFNQHGLDKLTFIHKNIEEFKSLAIDREFKIEELLEKSLAELELQLSLPTTANVASPSI